MTDTLKIAHLRWRPISTAPRDRDILVFAPGAIYDLPDVVCVCRWHPDAGFCVCELRDPTHWTDAALDPA